MNAKPRSIVSPRAFSSGNRSGSVPVSARTSVDLPWSTWPAVATTRTRLSPVAAAATGARRRAFVVDRVDGAEVAHDATVLDPIATTRSSRNRLASAASTSATAIATPADGIVEARQRAAAGDRFGVDDLRARHASRRSPRRALAQRVDRGRRHAPERDRGAVAVEVRERHRLAAPRASTLSARTARASGWALQPIARASRAADDDAGLRTAEQLVARERHQRGAGVEALAHAGLVAQPAGSTAQPRRALVEQARTGVDDHRRAERRELGDRRRRRRSRSCGSSTRAPSAASAVSSVIARS